MCSHRVQACALSCSVSSFPVSLTYLKELEHLVTLEHTRGVDCARRALVRIGASFEKCLDHVVVDLEHCASEWSLSAVVRAIDIGALLQQLAHELRVSRVCGEHEKRVSVVVREVWRDTVLDVRDQRHVAFAGHVEEPGRELDRLGRERGSSRLGRVRSLSGRTRLRVGDRAAPRSRLLTRDGAAAGRGLLARNWASTTSGLLPRNGAGARGGLLSRDGTSASSRLLARDGTLGSGGHGERWMKMSREVRIAVTTGVYLSVVRLKHPDVIHERLKPIGECLRSHWSSQPQRLFSSDLPSTSHLQTSACLSSLAPLRRSPSCSGQDSESSLDYAS